MNRERPSRPLWHCPSCGHTFVTRNVWHSCRRHEIEEHFWNKKPAVRDLFDAFRAEVEACGPVTVYAQKTRIVFQVRTRFAGCQARKSWLVCSLRLKRRVPSKRFFRIEEYTPRDYGHHFRLRSIDQLDDELRQLVREAYSVGCQEGPT